MKWTKPKAAVDDTAARDLLEKIETRAFKTYRARQSASARLGKRGRAWNWALIAFATATTIASIGMLTDVEMYGGAGDTLLVCLSILSLVASLTTSNLDYSGRSKDMFVNYRKVQRLSVEAEKLRLQRAVVVTSDDVDKVSAEYQALLDESENHTAGDHLRHYSRSVLAEDPYHSTDSALLRARRWAMIGDFILTFFPYATLIVPTLLVIPLANSILTK